MWCHRPEALQLDDAQCIFCEHSGCHREDDQWCRICQCRCELWTSHGLYGFGWHGDSGDSTRAVSKVRHVNLVSVRKIRVKSEPVEEVCIKVRVIKGHKEVQRSEFGGGRVSIIVRSVSRILCTARRQR